MLKIHTEEKNIKYIKHIHDNAAADNRLTCVKLHFSIVNDFIGVITRNTHILLQFPVVWTT